ncbi:MAG TPA: hypothetical protein VNA24_30520 [Hyalangium sp.]|nr:hypothetical protein [Hyalangium sp.]
MKQTRLSAWLLVSLLATVAGACNVTPLEEALDETASLREKSDELLYCNPYTFCPPNYIREVYCSIHCGSCPYGRYGSQPNATECIYSPPWGSITANPAQVSIPLGSLGTTTICTNANVYNTEVWVSMDGGPETLFASHSLSGCASAPWIQIGHSYQFNLYVGSGRLLHLDSVTVTGIQGAPPQGGPCDSCPGNTSCFCGDNVCRSPNEMCP